MATKPPPLPPDARRPKRGRRRRRARHRSGQSAFAAPAGGARRPAAATACAARAAAASADARPPPEFPPPPELVAPWREAAPASQIEVSNRSDGGFFYWLLRFYAFGLLCALGLLVMAGFGTYIYFAATLPTLPDIATYHEVAATTTVMRAADGTPLAELATERREILVVRPLPPAAGARVPGRRGPPLLRAPGPRLPRHRARADGQPARRRGRAGRLDHHPAGREVVPDRPSGRFSGRSARRSWRGASSGTSRSATSSPST